MPPGPGQDRLVEVGSVPVDTAGASGEAGKLGLHLQLIPFFIRYYCYYYHLKSGAASGVNVGLGSVRGVTYIILGTNN